MSTVHPMTPNEQRINLAEHTARALEWPLVVEALAMHARSSMGIARCRSLVLATDLTESARRQQQTVEVADLQQGDDPMPAISFPDVRGPLSRAGKGATLEGH